MPLPPSFTRCMFSMSSCLTLLLCTSFQAPLRRLRAVLRLQQHPEGAVSNAFGCSTHTHVRHCKVQLCQHYTCNLTRVYIIRNEPQLSGGKYSGVCNGCYCCRCCCLYVNRFGAIEKVEQSTFLSFDELFREITHGPTIATRAASSARSPQQKHSASSC